MGLGGHFQANFRRNIQVRFATMDYEEKQLGLEALNVSATLTDDHVEVNVVLGVDDPNSRLITTAQTSA